MNPCAFDVSDGCLATKKPHCRTRNASRTICANGMDDYKVALLG